ncbi:YbdD/YjiX family protein [Arthrobacter sp. UM1]|uniref:YbdD/YjiX family protein n=1 Tax=Arthrobacter sp. UM1 TaxID=2766776 RepID=UPI001CF66321|nr:YbdD/YjiX family protein [Arthrobacter sp. UM1]MCB4209181.1 YbdD/YjiX family protein [Arthrobacter sp. UM1]
MADIARRVLGALDAGRRYLRGVVGADAYEKYLAHHERRAAAGECCEPVLSEREFWREKTDRLDREPQGRCC